MNSAAHILLLDHDNIDFDRISVRGLLELWIDADPMLQQTAAVLRLRAYGGWFVESISSDARHRAAEFYMEAAPSLFKYQGRYYSVAFEFADSLVGASALVGPSSVRIANTVVRRASAPTVRVIPGAPGCPESDCQLRATRRWIRNNRACTRAACPKPFAACFERVEQKQVDVHLAVDLMAYLSAPNGQVGLVTDDADILPALAAVAASGAARDRLSVIRSNQRPTYMDSFLRGSGARIALIPL